MHDEFNRLGSPNGSRQRLELRPILGVVNVKKVVISLVH